MAWLYEPSHSIHSTCNTCVKRPPVPLILSLEPTTIDILSKCDANATLADEPSWCDAELVEADYKKTNYTLHISQA